MSKETIERVKGNNIADELHRVVDLASRMKIINQSGQIVIERVGQITPFWLELDQGIDALYTTKDRQIVKNIRKDNDKHDLVLCDTDFIEAILKDRGGHEYYVLIDDEQTNYVIQRDSDNLYFVYLEANGERGFFGRIADIFRFPIPDYENPEFVRYIDFEPDSTSDVIMAYKTKEGWFSGSHRTMYHFKVGETISVSPDSLLLSHGYVPGSPRYEKETEHIDKIKQLVKDGRIEVKDFETAKKLAIRLCEATG